MIYILDENLQIVDILRKYNFAQYNNKFRDIGVFKINAQLIDENIYILDETKQYYVLFDFDEYIFGQVTKIKQSGEGDNDKEIVIEGKLSKYILTKRVINGTINYKGKTFGLVKEMIDSNIVSSSNVKRNLPIEINYDEEYLTSVCSDVTKQITGGYVWEEVEKLLTQDNLGIDFVPNIITDSNTTNIDKWYLTINAGVDRTKTNKYGNNTVIFSQQLSNIASVDYERDVEEYTNYAYIAGEGEEENRKWYEVNRTDKDSSGWNRKELWIDARDIQSESEDGTTLSETEYEKLIKERANEKFSESDVQESYEATLTEKNAQYTYGVDYNLGDWCTVTDINLNKELDVQITEITVTVQGTRKIVDVGFTYGLIKKDPIKQTQQNTININKTENNVRYLENITKPLTKTFSFLKDATGKIIGIAIGKIAEVENTLEVAFRGLFKEAVEMEKELDVAGKVNANGGVIVTGETKFNDLAILENGKSICGMTTDNSVYGLAGVNTSDYSIFGYGGYSASKGRSVLYGNQIRLISKNAVKITSPTAGLSARDYGVNKILWSGGAYMNASTIATLSEAVSAQPHGIVLVFSRFVDNVPVNYDFVEIFVPKGVVALGTWYHTFQLVSINHTCIGTKFLQISDTSIKGEARNENTGTSNGVTYANNGWVLRYVIGV